MVHQETLKKVGLKVTSPRLRILEIFHTQQSHLSAEDVYKILLKDGLDIGLATIYRVLTQFSEVGILEKHHFESERAVFELTSNEHHDHMVCTECHAVEEFFNQTIETEQHNIAQEKGFILKGHAMLLYGICKKCQKSEII
jgi:Fur family transcriptional regulator, ferric uptake regulator